MIRTIVGYMALAWLAACAAQPRSGSGPASPASAAATPVAIPSGPPPSGQPAAAPALSRKILSDYKLRIKDGKRYYCTREAVLGSHFERTICLTEEQVAEVERRRQEAREGLERAQKTCGGTVCTGLE